MSDTPRTDAAIFAVDVAFVSHDGLASEPKEVVEPEFARQLEHENVALRADVLEQCMLIAKGSEREYSLRGRIEQLERENAALRAADQIDISALRRENAGLRSQAIGQEETITRLQCTIKAAMHVEGQLQAENAALRADKERLHRLAYDMAAEMEHHGGEQAFDSAARYWAARAKEAKP